MLRSILFIFILFLSSLMHAQSPEDTGAGDDLLVYRSPNDGDTYVPTRTTLIIRPDPSIMNGRVAEDFIFSIIGESSGIHIGKVLISNQTIIFKPEQPFTLNEKVNVNFSVAKVEEIPPIIYSFQITPMSDRRQNYWLNVLRDKEKKEIEEFQRTADAKNMHQGVQSSVLDTLPANFPLITIDFVNSAKTAPGNIFIAPNNNIGVTSDFLIIADNTGTPVFQRDMSPPDSVNKLPIGAEDFKMGLNNTLSYFKLDTVIHGEIFFGAVFLMDSTFTIIDSFRCGNGYHADGHDFQMLSNGHALLIAYDPIDTIDMREVTGDPNASKRATVFGAIIQELDKEKNVIFQWRSWDHFKITDANSHVRLNNPNERAFDYAHINSVEMDTDGTIIASFRHMDEVTKISKNGKIIWRWGGKNNYFTFVGDTLQFSQQHDVRRISNGHITMWDNGNYRKTVWGDGSYHDTVYSRAVEYDLDESSLKARVVWQFSDLPISSAAGNAQRLPNGNTLIGLGIGLGFLNVPNTLEVTPNGEKVFQLSLPKGTFNYRSFRFDFPKHSSAVYSTSTEKVFGIQNIYPNPASNNSTVTFSATEAGIVNVELLNILGQRVRSFQENVSGKGTYTTSFDLHELSAGTYYCKLSQNGKVSLKVIVLQR